MDIPDYLIISTFAAGAQALAHFFPWRRVLGRDLRKLEGYIIGTAIILTAQATMSFYRPLSTEDVMTPAIFSGLSVLICNAFTHSLNMRDELAVATGQTEKLLEAIEQVKEAVNASHE